MSWPLRQALAKRTTQKVEKKPIFDFLPEMNMTFNELTKWYINLERVKSLAYYAGLKIYLKNFNSEFGDFVVTDLKPIYLENYQAARKKAGKSDSYIDQEVGAARTLINKAFDNDLVSGDAIKPFKRVKKLLKRN